MRKTFHAFEGLFLSLWNFASYQQPAFTLRHLDIKDLSRPLASYPDTQSTHRFREEIHKGLMDPQCRTIPGSVTQKTNKEAWCSLQSKNMWRGLECGDLWRGWLSQRRTVYTSFFLKKKQNKQKTKNKHHQSFFFSCLTTTWQICDKTLKRMRYRKQWHGIALYYNKVTFEKGLFYNIKML